MVWEGIEEGFGDSWELLSRFLASFFTLVFGMVFQRALGYFRARFWVDFRRF